MITRYLSSAAAGLAVTTSLLWVMHFLIESAEPVEGAERPRLVLDYTRVKEDSIVDTIREPPHPLPEPAETPSHAPPIDPSGKTTPIGVASSATVPTGPTMHAGHWGALDSAIINIINAQPDYPIKASELGMDGYVIVSFDVTEIGTVENVRIVETSHKMFNRAAIKAAERSRYKPKTVDGSAQVTRGLQKLFTFKMET